MTAPRDLPRDIGEFIRDLRRNARISLRQLAEQAGVSNPYLSQIERGLRKPSAEVLAQLASALRVSTPLMYLRAGLLDTRDGQDVLAAIAADPELTLAQKQSLTQIYETFRRENTRAAAEADEVTEIPITEPAHEATDEAPAAAPVSTGTGGARPAATGPRVPATGPRVPATGPRVPAKSSRVPVKSSRAPAKRTARMTPPEPSAEATSAKGPGADETTEEKA